jgi:hypothetical protein
MVSVNFKLSRVERVDLNIIDIATCGTILDICATKIGEEIGPFIASNNGKVATCEDYIDSNAIVYIYHAISDN